MNDFSWMELFDENDEKLKNNKKTIKQKKKRIINSVFSAIVIVKIKILRK